MRLRLALSSLLVLAAGPSAAHAAEVAGFSDAGVMPAEVLPNTTATVAFNVTAPAGGNVTHFRLHGRAMAGPDMAPAPLTAGFKAADSGSWKGVIPSLTVKGARLEGPGTLVGLAQTLEAYLRSGCVRDGAAAWGSDIGYRLRLDAGQTTRLLVDVDVPAGLAVSTNVLTLEPAAWNAVAPADTDRSVLGGGAEQGPLTVGVPRTTGADSLTLISKRGTGKTRGTVQLSGVIAPARAGQRIEVLGRAVANDTDASVYFARPTPERPKAKGQKVLALAKTDANGKWTVRVKLGRRTALVARTTQGLAGRSTAGVSCPLVLKA